MGEENEEYNLLYNNDVNDCMMIIMINISYKSSIGGNELSTRDSRSPTTCR